MIPFIGKEAEAKLNWHGLMAAMEAGHKLPKAEVGDTFLYSGPDTLLNRSAMVRGLGTLIKAGTICPGNAAKGKPTINGIVTLFGPDTGEPVAILDFHLVTKWKTAGDSLLSASRLARKDSRNILLVGAGVVANSMIDAYRAVFPDARFKVWSRQSVTAAALASPRGIEPVKDLEAAVGWADIICTATMAKEPLVKGDWLRPGQHLDLIGAYTPAMREVDDAAMARARVFVDARATTVHHIGEIMSPIKSGAIREADVLADFYELDRFQRRSDDEITIAKNGGGAHLDLMTATYIVGAVG